MRIPRSCKADKTNNQRNTGYDFRHAFASRTSMIGDRWISSDDDRALRTGVMIRVPVTAVYQQECGDRSGGKKRSKDDPLGFPRSI
jgi:hypothetical protein